MRVDNVRESSDFADSAPLVAAQATPRGPPSPAKNCSRASSLRYTFGLDSSTVRFRVILFATTVVGRPCFCFRFGALFRSMQQAKARGSSSDIMHGRDAYLSVAANWQVSNLMNACSR